MPKLQSIDISPSNQQHNLLLDHGKLAYLEKVQEFKQEIECSLAVVISLTSAT